MMSSQAVEIDYSNVTPMRSEEVADLEETHLGELMNSIFRFASTGTRFAMQQMWNSVTFFARPGEVMNRVRHSLDNISDALDESLVENKRSEPPLPSYETYSSEPVAAVRAMDRPSAIPRPLYEPPSLRY